MFKQLLVVIVAFIARVNWSVAIVTAIVTAIVWIASCAVVTTIVYIVLWQSTKVVAIT
ncbi:MAG: hypothetical protein RRY78_04645 [Clostridia bacterium]